VSTTLQLSRKWKVLEILFFQKRKVRAFAIFFIQQLVAVSGAASQPTCVNLLCGVEHFSILTETDWSTLSGRFIPHLHFLG
jgi:hypothetical protein